MGVLIRGKRTPTIPDKSIESILTPEEMPVVDDDEAKIQAMIEYQRRYGGKSGSGRESTELTTKRGRRGNQLNKAKSPSLATKTGSNTLG